jgi:toxin ParE1/3/4
MGRIRRRPFAKADILGIYAYISKENPQAARRYLLGLEQSLFNLSDIPGMGRANFARDASIRAFPYRNHLLIYRELEDKTGIELIRVLHGAQDWMTILDPDP